MIVEKQPLTPQEKLEVERIRQLLAAPAPGATASVAPGPAADGTNFVPLSPLPPQNGTKIDDSKGAAAAQPAGERPAESEAGPALAASGLVGGGEAENGEPVADSYRAAEAGGTQCGDSDEPPADEVDENPLRKLMRRALTQAKRGRPAAFDDHARGKLVALLALGLSVRQSATVLGVSHPTVLRALQADPELREEVVAARYQAQLQPLGCVIREAQRSWRAATWLLKYLDGKLAGHEETPDEKREREHREQEEAQLRYEEREAARLSRAKKRREEYEAEQLALRRAEVEAMFPRRKRKPKATPAPQ